MWISEVKDGSFVLMLMILHLLVIWHISKLLSFVYLTQIREKNPFKF